MRTTVRRKSAIEEIESAPTAREFSNDVEVMVVPDMTKDDAFMQALQGVTYVLHVASPMPTKVRKQRMQVLVESSYNLLTGQYLRQMVLTKNTPSGQPSTVPSVFSSQRLRSLP